MLREVLEVRAGAGLRDRAGVQQRQGAGRSRHEDGRGGRQRRAAEAETLVPDDFKSLSDDLDVAKDAMAKGDYKTALASAQAIQQKANDVLAKAKARKDELTKSWADMSDSVPKMMDAIKSRVDILSQSKKLPAGHGRGQARGRQGRPRLGHGGVGRSAGGREGRKVDRRDGEGGHRQEQGRGDHGLARHAGGRRSGGSSREIVPVRNPEGPAPAGLFRLRPHSHSIVAGGFDVTS